MKIAIVTATYPPYHGGTGNVARNHAHELARLGHDVHVWTATHENRHADVDGGVTVHSLKPLLRIGNGVLLPQLLWKLRGVDIIHWHYPFFGGELTALAAKLMRTPLVVTYHQDVILAGLLGKVAALLEATVGKWALLSAESILFTSDDYAKRSKVRSFLSDKVISTVPNGVSLSHFTPANAKHPNKTNALLVAGLDAAHHFKGVSNFLQALAYVENVNGVIVGDGDLRAQYEDEARELGIAARVSFAGRVSDDRLADYYRQASVTVLPSTTMGEAFGLVLVESLACATPVIASDLPGVRTVVANGVDGYLVEPNDVADLADKLRTMRDFLGETRSKMGITGRQKVEALYGWEEIGRKLDSIYHTVLKQHNATK